MIGVAVTSRKIPTQLPMAKTHIGHRDIQLRIAVEAISGPCQPISTMYWHLYGILHVSVVILQGQKMPSRKIHQPVEMLGMDSY